MLRGEPLELVARETNVSIARLSEWRERALAGAATALKERECDDRDDEIKVGRSGCRSACAGWWETIHIFQYPVRRGRLSALQKDKAGTCGMSKPPGTTEWE
jgi:hypothetical protein